MKVREDKSMGIVTHIPRFCLELNKSEESTRLTYTGLLGELGKKTST
jgi:hypothetical protein